MISEITNSGRVFVARIGVLVCTGFAIPCWILAHDCIYGTLQDPFATRLAVATAALSTVIGLVMLFFALIREWQVEGIVRELKKIDVDVAATSLMMTDNDAAFAWLPGWEVVLETGDTFVLPICPLSEIGFQSGTKIRINWWRFFQPQQYTDFSRYSIVTDNSRNCEF